MHFVSLKIYSTKLGSAPNSDRNFYLNEVFNFIMDFSLSEIAQVYLTLDTVKCIGILMCTAQVKLVTN